MNLRPVLFALVLLTLAGCAKVPFAPTTMPALVNPDPQAIRAAFDRDTPRHFISDDTVIITAPFNQIAALGILRVDRTAGTFDLMCLNHVGVQLFLLSGTREKTDIRFALPPLLEHREILQAIGEDIRHMYFDLVPTPAATTEIQPTFVHFKDPTPEGTLQYKFGGPEKTLLEKRLLGWFWPVWRVRYYEYTRTPNGLYPRGIVMVNHRYYYRIVVKNRSWQIEQAPTP